MILELLIFAAAVHCCCRDRHRDPMFYDEFNRFNDSVFKPLRNASNLSIHHLHTTQTALEDRWGVLQVYLTLNHLRDAYVNRIIEIKPRVYGSSLQDLLSICKNHSSEIGRRERLLGRLALYDHNLFPDGLLSPICGTSLEEAMEKIFTSRLERHDFLNGYMVKQLGDAARNQLYDHSMQIPFSIWRPGDTEPDIYMCVPPKGKLAHVLDDVRELIKNSAARLYIIDYSQDDAVEVDLDDLEGEMPLGILYLYHHDKTTGRLNLHLRPE